MSTEAPAKKPITDSPWFWGYLFATAGLVALMLVTPKFGDRQAQIERQIQGRQRALQQSQDETPTTAMSDSDHTVITLQPLYWLLAGVLAVAWSVLWWTRFRTPISPSVKQEAGS